MRKIAYKSVQKVEIEPLKNLALDFSKENSAEQIGRGISAIESTNPPNEFSNRLPKEHIRKKENKQPNVKNTIDKLVELGDIFDEENESFAAFTDFLLQKFAAIGEDDFVKSFNETIMKIYLSDIANKNDAIKKLAVYFSRLIMINKSNGLDDFEAKKNAYDKFLISSEKFLV